MSLRVGVVGLGFMGSTHLRAWQHVGEAHIAAVCSNVEEKLHGDLSSVFGNLGGEAQKYDFSAVRKYRQLDDLLADPEIDAVDLCLPTFLHAPAATAALRAGKHVLVEKPMALDPQSADEMLAEQERSGKILMTAQVLRFIPQYRKLHDLLRSGGYGKVHCATMRRRCAAPTWNEWLQVATQSGGGIYDLLIHDIDWVLWTFGVPEAVSATGFESLEEGVDTIVATLYYDAIPSVVITGGWHNRSDYPFSMEYTVVTERGTFEYDSQQAPDLLFHPVQGKTRAKQLDEEDGFVAELRYFTQCCVRGEQPDFCPPRESALALRAALLLLEARSKNGERIPCRI